MYKPRMYKPIKNRKSRTEMSAVNNQAYAFFHSFYSHNMMEQHQFLKIAKLLDLIQVRQQCTANLSSFHRCSMRSERRLSVSRVLNHSSVALAVCFGSLLLLGFWPVSYFLQDSSSHHKTPSQQRISLRGCCYMDRELCSGPYFSA